MLKKYRVTLQAVPCRDNNVARISMNTHANTHTHAHARTHIHSRNTRVVHGKVMATKKTPITQPHAIATQNTSFIAGSSWLTTEGKR
jgi:hypothetical protein